MGEKYVARFVYAGRCPVNEPTMRGDYNVTLGQFIADPDGKMKAVEGSVLTPAASDKLGWTLDAILGEIAAAAIRDRDAALETEARALAARDKAREERAAAVRERDDVIKAANEALTRQAAAREAAEANAREVAAEAEQLRKTLAGLLGEVDVSVKR